MTRACVLASCIILAACGSGRAAPASTQASSAGASATTAGNPISPGTSSSVTARTSPEPGAACGSYAYRPQSSDLADDILVSGTDCTVARQVVMAAPDRPNSGRPYVAEGFRCAAGAESQPPGGGISSVLYRCDNGRGAVITFRRY